MIAPISPDLFPEDFINSFENIPDSEPKGLESPSNFIGQIRQRWSVLMADYVTDSSDIKATQWKVESYEERLEKVKQIVFPYRFSSQEIIGKESALIRSGQILKEDEVRFDICDQNFLNVEEINERFSLTRLNELREKYKRFFDQLRQAEEWAQTQPMDLQSKNIHLICHLLYTSIDLNERCFKIVELFKEFGKEALLNAQMPTLPEDKQYDLIRELYLIHSYINVAPAYLKSPLLKRSANSVLGHVNGVFWTPFDPNCQSNPIHVLFEKVVEFPNQPKQVAKAIAMGSPTIEIGGSGVARINPEFLGYLRHCKQNHEVHFYINHQSLFPRSRLGGDESTRCQALHALAKQEEFERVFHVVTLSQNSWFYDHADSPNLNLAQTKAQLIRQLKQPATDLTSQIIPLDLIEDKELHQWIEITLEQKQKERKGSNFIDITDYQNFMQSFYEELNNHLYTLNKPMGYCIYHPSIKAFKNELMAQLFEYSSEKTGQRLSIETVSNEKIQKWTKDMLDAIHQIVFKGSMWLTLEERRVFIRLVYRNLSQYLLIETQANYYNTSCKDRIDRGAATDAEDYAYTMILNGQETEPEVIDFFNTLVFSRALMVRKRSIIDKRLDRLFETVKFILEHKEGIRQLNDKLFPEISISFNLNFQ